MRFWKCLELVAFLGLLYILERLEYLFFRGMILNNVGDALTQKFFWGKILIWGICVLIPTLKCNCDFALIFLIL